MIYVIYLWISNVNLGYNKARPKYEELYQETKNLCKQYLPDNDPINNHPYILVHKLNMRKTKNNKQKEYHQVTMTYEFFLRLIELSHDRL